MISNIDQIYFAQHIDEHQIIGSRIYYIDYQRNDTHFYIILRPADL